MPKISIIVPVFNSEQEIKDCLDSLVEQTEKDLEIIVIDDASTDHSLEIINAYTKKYANIKVYKNEVNKGVGYSRNLGIALATGEYITFVDSDDYVNPTMYEELYEAAKKYNKPELITTGILFVREDEYRTKDLSFLGKTSPKVIHPLDNEEAIYAESPTVCNKLFRKDTVKDYKFLTNCLWEDIAFSFTKFLEANTVIEVPTPNYFYRRDITDGLSSKNYKENDRIMDIFKVADELENELKKTGRYDYFKTQIKLLQIAVCLQRVDEVNFWQIEEEKKNIVKKTMLSTIYQKYGDLEGIDNIALQCKVSFKTIDEYSDFIDQKKNEHNKKLTSK